mmetsp:Transcript_5689/g.17579  ORF Transcript_5689/g.17579 Transcript_5689/m.17579 type:complete len:284 (+) Transcript_5689:923-1774(+)
MSSSTTSGDSSAASGGSSTVSCPGYSSGSSCHTPLSSSGASSACNGTSSAACPSSPNWDVSMGLIPLPSAMSSRAVRDRFHSLASAASSCPAGCPAPGSGACSWSCCRFPGPPSAPFLPLAPLAPLSPVGLRGPLAPKGPLSPLAPMSPLAPLTPLSPLAPFAPLSPLAPALPLVPLASSSPFGPFLPPLPLPAVSGGALPLALAASKIRVVGSRMKRFTRRCERSSSTEYLSGSRPRPMSGPAPALTAIFTRFTSSALSRPSKPTTNTCRGGSSSPARKLVR